MVMYDNELKTKENKNWSKGKIEPQYVQSWRLDLGTLKWEARKCNLHCN